MLTYTPVALYHLAKLLYPAGLRGHSGLPIVVEGRAMELRFSTDRGHGDDIEFLLHFPRTNYARRSPIVYADGRIEEDTYGGVPEQDRFEGEQNIVSTVDELLSVIFDTLLAHLQCQLPPIKA